MTIWSCHRFSRSFARLALPVIALSLTAFAADAQVTIHAALNATATTSQPTSTAAQTTGAATSHIEPSPEQVGPPQKTLTAKAVDKVKQVARSATDIFSR